MTSFVRIKRLSDLWRLTFFRKFSAFEKSKDCQSQIVPETCSSSMTMDEDDDPCPPCPSSRQDPPCPCPPKPPKWLCPDTDPRKLVFWRVLSLFVALPLIVVMSAVTYARQKEKAKQPREPFLNLPYMCRRTKPFPWGDGNHSLFHNPVKNPVPPHGYEVEDPNERLYKKTGN